jgi:tetratricopeptide (TPR) repeat protein
MAAAQVAGLSVAEIAAGLDQRFVLLTSGSRTALPRQQTLRATLDWSYDLLTHAEQKLLARLSVFAGGWTAEAVKAVCGEGLPVLLQLVQKSLVSVQRSGSQTRYRMVETIREYASEKLRVLEETAAVRERHLAYFVALAEETMDLGGRHVDAWVKRVEVEHDNLRAAFAWARTREDAGEMMLRLAGGLRPFRHHRGFYGEGLAWLDEALARGSKAPPLARAKALLAKASLLAVTPNSQPVLPLAEESLRLFQEADERLGVAWSLEVLANCTPFSAGEAHVESLTTQALSLFQELNCLAGIGRALRVLADMELHRGNQPHAEMLCEESLAVAQQIEDTLAIASALFRLSSLNPERAGQLCALEVARQRALSDPNRLAAFLQCYGEILIALGEYEHAEAVLQECLALWQQLNRRLGIIAGPAYTLQLLGLAAQGCGDINRATTLLKQASKLYQEDGGIYAVYTTRFLLASAALSQGQYSSAGDNLRACLMYFHRQGHALNSVLVLSQLAALGHEQGLSQRNATLLGAVARFERDVQYAFHMGIIRVMRRNFAQIMAAGRACRNNPEFAAAWAAGQAMTLDEAIAYALA